MEGLGFGTAPTAATASVICLILVPGVMWLAMEPGALSANRAGVMCLVLAPGSSGTGRDVTCG